jgi:hypothetical protein
VALVMGLDALAAEPQSSTLEHSVVVYPQLLAAHEAWLSLRRQRRLTRVFSIV